MARALEDIIKEIDPGYAGSRTGIQTQINALPGETASQLDGLQAQAQQSHDDILNSARRRGLGFAGIPVGEQVKYDATTFKPAVANLYSAQNQRKSSLEEALNSLYRDQRNNAMNLRESEINRDEQIRQFNENLAFQREQLAEQARAARASEAASSNLASYFGGGGSTPAAGRIDSSKGFKFFDSTGAPINAAQYVSLYGGQLGLSYRQLLQQMANKGDNNAKIALRFVGDDGKFGGAPSQYAGALAAVGATGTFARSGGSASKGSSAFRQVTTPTVMSPLWRG